MTFYDEPREGVFRHFPICDLPTPFKPVQGIDETMPSRSFWREVLCHFPTFTRTKIDPEKARFRIIDEPIQGVDGAVPSKIATAAA